MIDMPITIAELWVCSTSRRARHDITTFPCIKHNLNQVSWETEKNQWFLCMCVSTHVMWMHVWVQGSQWKLTTAQVPSLFIQSIYGVRCPALHHLSAATLQMLNVEKFLKILCFPSNWYADKVLSAEIPTIRKQLRHDKNPNYGKSGVG